MTMSRGRVEAFSDGVIAIIITIMVLEMKVPHGEDWAALWSLRFVFFSYVLSFVYLAIYWNNHHHLMHTVERVDGRIMWANLHLLFWLSLVPFATGWMGENHFAALPTAVYGAVMVGAALAWTVLQTAIVAVHGRQSRLATAVGRDRKGKISLGSYVLGSVLAAFGLPWIALLIYALVAVIWFVPDRRIAARIEDDSAR